MSAAGLALAACSPAATQESDAATAETKTGSVETLSADELSRLLEEGDIHLIDVRSDDEVASGMIPGAEHIALDDFDPAKLGIEDTSKIVLYCRSGRRSGVAAKRLAQFTGQDVRHLDGGIIAWQDSGRAITQAR